MQGSFFHGLISGINEGITAARKQNAEAAENEIKGEQDILTHIARTSEDPQIANTAISALLNIHESGKPTGFLGKLLGKRSANPEIAALIAGAKPKAGEAKGEAANSTVGLDTAAPPAPTVSNLPLEGFAAAGAPEPEPGSISSPPVSPLPVSPAGPAAQPINTTNNRTPITYSAGVQSPAPISTSSPSSFPPPPPASLPPSPGGYGIPTPLQDFAAREALRSQRLPTTGPAVMAREIADLTEEAATLGDQFPAAKAERLKALRELAKIEYSDRDKALATDKTRNIELQAKLRKDTRSLEARAIEAKEAGNTEEYNNIVSVRKELGLAGRAPKAPKDRSKISGLTAAVLANPTLFNGLTPTQKGEIIPDLAAAGFTSFGRDLSNTAVVQLAQSKSAIAELTDLRGVLLANSEYLGPVAGLQALNPWSPARKAQATIDLVKQRVGKALEGGVLRKEDEDKYKKILATLNDTPDTAIYKIDGLIESLERDMDIFIETQTAAGRDTSRQPKSGRKTTNTNPVSSPPSPLDAEVEALEASLGLKKKK